MRQKPVEAIHFQDHHDDDSDDDDQGHGDDDDIWGYNDFDKVGKSTLNRINRRNSKMLYFCGHFAAIIQHYANMPLHIQNIKKSQEKMQISI